LGISADGSVIVGWSLQSSGNEALRWNSSGAQRLGVLPGDLTSEAADASGDGAIVIGFSRPFGGPEAAFIWDEEHGMQALADVLVNDYGFDLTGWTLSRATSISDDGKVIVGWGKSPNHTEQAWIAVLGGPSAPACSNDLDDDGDGKADYPEDEGCKSVLDESEAAGDCGDGLDNDGDGLVDYPDDPGCLDAASTETPQCQDGIDNDNQVGIDFDGGASLDLDADGFVDAAFNPTTPAVGLADPQCTAATRNKETSCGLGFELSLLLPPLIWLRSRRGRT
jgi:hypothetical protein